jgi:RNA polymerase sigma factor (sigma-70 family)
MSTSDDKELLRRYALTRSEPAFSEIVRRHVNLVYSAALRITQNGAIAEDTAQLVFCDLAKKAVGADAELLEVRSLSGWLYRSACFAASKAVRTEARRRLREKEAQTMNELNGGGGSTQGEWDELRPEIDSVILELEETDREAVILRFFTGHKFSEVGTHLGISENAARMKVDRALDRLRVSLTRRGIASSGSALGMLLAQHGAVAAPSGIAATIVTFSLANAATSSVSFTTTIQILMASTQAKVIIATIVAAAFIIPMALQYSKNVSLQEEVTLLRLRGGELEKSRGEVERLSAVALQRSTELEAEQAELVRLRRELAAAKLRDAKQAATSKIPTRRENVATATDPVKPAEDPLVPATEWKNLGVLNPSATLQTLEWAKTSGDLNVMLSCVAWGDEATRRRAEEAFAAAPDAVRAQYATADAFALSLLSGAPSSPDSPRPTAYRVLEERSTGEEVTLQVESHWGDGKTAVNPVRYVRIGNEWRQALEFAPATQRRLGLSLQQNTN